MKHFASILIVSLSLLALPISAHADTMMVGKAAPKKQPSRFDTYMGQICEKFDMGAMNLLMGWTEFLTEPLDKAQQGETVVGKLAHGSVGLATGLLRTVSTTVGGILNVTTVPVPAQIPIPGGGVDYQKMTNYPASQSSAESM